MKKILSVILAVMMIFGSLAVSASAASIDLTHSTNWYPGGFAANQTVLIFDFNGGKATGKYYDVWDGTTFVATDEISGTYIQLPVSATDLVAGTSAVVLPFVTPPSGSAFMGWDVQIDYSPDGYNTLLAGNSYYRIPASAAGKTITFKAWYTSGEQEEDTMATILGILVKVFGAIIGILMYGGDTEAGVAMMNQILGGLDL